MCVILGNFKFFLWMLRYPSDSLIILLVSYKLSDLLIAKIFLCYICRLVIMVLVGVGRKIGWLEREAGVLVVAYVSSAFVCFMLMLCNICPLELCN